jgi:hypothetical protein
MIAHCSDAKSTKQFRETNVLAWCATIRKSIAAVVPTARLIAGDAFGSVATGVALDAAKRFAQP